MTREEREKLPPDEQAVFCAAFAASFVMHTQSAVKAFREEWKS